MARVYHYSPAVARRDAIGYSLTFLHRAMLRVGIASFLVCDKGSHDAAPPSTLTVEAFAALKPTSSDVMLFHYSFADLNVERLMALPCRKVMIYHNITPGHFFRAAGQHWAGDMCDLGRASLARMNGSFDVAVGDSAYNAAELAENLYPAPEVVPVFYNDRFYGDCSVGQEDFLRRRLTGEVNLVFIGRYVPNKRLDNLIRIVDILKNLLRLPVRLRLHGKIGDRTYFFSLRRLTEELGVEAEVDFAFDQPQDALRTSLQAADAFVSVSEHEGFGVPLVEAFSAGCPVVALAGSAVTETCGSAGSLVRAADLEQIAGTIAVIRQDRELRTSLIRTQGARAEQFSTRRTLRKWDALLRDLVQQSLVAHAHRV